MRKFYIYLDDLRYIPWGYDQQLKDYDSFVEYMKSLGSFVASCHISFDHDLGEGKNGYDCAKWLINWCIENDYHAPTYEIHSANPVGRKNIESVFETYEKIYGGK